MVSQILKGERVLALPANPEPGAIYFVKNGSGFDLVVAGKDGEAIPLNAAAEPVIPAGIPTGTISEFGGPAAPSGWLECNGAAISRVDYAALWLAIGGYWGSGNGTTTFNIPDLRGVFTRGWDNGRGVDAGRGLGSNQAQDFKSFHFENNGGPAPTGWGHAANIAKTGKNGNIFGGKWEAPGGFINFTWDSSEIRPRNSAVMKMIKF